MSKRTENRIKGFEPKQPFVLSEGFSGSVIHIVLLMGSSARPSIFAATTPKWRPVRNAGILALILVILLIFAPPTPAQPESQDSKLDQLRQAMTSIQEQLLNLQGMVNRLTDQVAGTRVLPDTPPAASAAIDWPQAQDAFTKGQEAEDAGRMLDAVENYALAIRTDPMNDAAFFHRANCLLRVGNLSAALSDLNDSLRLQPNNGRAYEVRSQVLIAMNRPADALIDVEETIRRDPSNPQGHLNKGNLLFNLRFPEAALGEYKTVAALDPKMPGIEKLIEIASMKAPKEPAPVAAIAPPQTPAPAPPPIVVAEPAPIVQALPVAPSAPQPSTGGSDRTSSQPTMPYRPSPTVRLNGPITSTPLRVEQPRTAAPSTGFPAMIETLTLRITARPTDAPAYNTRGYAYLRLRQFQDAIADFSRAIQLNPRYVNAFHNRSVARRLAGDIVGAEADARMAFQLVQKRP